MIVERQRGHGNENEVCDAKQREMAFWVLPSDLMTLFWSM